MDFRNITLVSPTATLRESYCAYIQELGDEERYPYPMDLDHSDFDAFVKTLDDYSNGISVPDGLVPNSTYWLVDGSSILGCSHLRHYLNDELEHAGGHIGLGVRPSCRGKGLGKVLLNLTLEKAYEKGIKHVHIHCYENNSVSKRLIESVGATLSSQSLGSSDSKSVLRYIIAQVPVKN